MRKLLLHFALLGAAVVLGAAVYERLVPNLSESPKAEISAPRAAAIARDAAAFDAAARRYQDMEGYAFCERLGDALRARRAGTDMEAMLSVAIDVHHVSPSAYDLIEHRRIVVGMPLCAVVAALGKPNEVIEIGTRAGSGYSAWFRGRKALVNLDANRVVTSFSY